jgi:hypothetical protein
MIILKRRNVLNLKGGIRPALFAAVGRIIGIGDTVRNIGPDLK